MATRQGTTKRSESSGNSQPATKASSRGSGRAAQSAKRSAADVASCAAQQLRDLAGRDVESVTGLQRSDDGWTVEVEVVEARRIPDSADMLALYEVQVDEEAELTGYRRLRRYGRGQTSDRSNR